MTDPFTPEGIQELKEGDVFIGEEKHDHMKGKVINDSGNGSKVVRFLCQECGKFRLDEIDTSIGLKVCDFCRMELREQGNENIDRHFRKCLENGGLVDKMDSARDENEC